MEAALSALLLPLAACSVISGLNDFSLPSGSQAGIGVSQELVTPMEVGASALTQSRPRSCIKAVTV